MDEALIETGIGSERIFDGTLLHVRRDTVKLPNGNTATREWIKHPGASSVIPLLEDGTIILVKQYRYPMREVILEIPAGKIDKGEIGKKAVRLLIDLIDGMPVSSITLKSDQLIVRDSTKRYVEE